MFRKRWHKYLYLLFAQYLILMHMVQSCGSNAFYFDAKTQEIVSRNGNFTDIVVEGDSLTYSLFLHKKADVSASDKVSVHHLDHYFEALSVSEGSTNVSENEHYRLIPNSSYNVTNYSVSDATGYSILLYVDLKGHVSELKR